MDKLKSLLRHLGYPHPILVVIMSILSFGGMIAASIVLGENHVITYTTYALSAYSLTIICLRIPEIVKFCKHLRSENPLVIRWFSDEKFRIHVSLTTALAIGVAYTALQLGLAIWHSSVWYYSLSAYYLILVIMRYILLRDIKTAREEKDPASEIRRYKFIGITLIPMSITLSGISLYIVEFGYGMKHHFITTIALAAFTFYALTMAIINAVKYRKYNSPLFSAAKAVGLVSAAVSILTLETAMLYAFGAEGEEGFRKTMTAMTSAAVFVFTLAVSIYMIARASKMLKGINEDGQ